MLAIGTGVVYPMQGGGRISAIKEHEDDGKIKQYYVLEMLCSDMIISVPIDNAKELGMRFPVELSELDKLVEVLRGKAEIDKLKSLSWNRRSMVYSAKMKTGDILEVAKVYKILHVLEKNKKISVGERRYLHLAKIILESELMLVQNVTWEEAKKWLANQMK